MAHKSCGCSVAANAQILYIQVSALDDYGVNIKHHNDFGSQRSHDRIELTYNFFDKACCRRAWRGRMGLSVRETSTSTYGLLAFECRRILKSNNSSSSQRLRSHFKLPTGPLQCPISSLRPSSILSRYSLKIGSAAFRDRT